MKHWFFLDQSDFLTNFLDLAAIELRKPAKSASIVKLQSLLDLAVRNPSSSSSNDPYKDELKVTMQSQGLYEWLMKIVSRTGSAHDGELDLVMDGEDEGRRSEKEKPLTGELSGLVDVATSIARTS
jgi:gamma-tubulin complex component 2